MIGGMPAEDSPISLEWLAISLRGLTLAGLSAVLIFQGVGSFTIAALILATGIWNVSLGVLAWLNRPLPWHRWLVVAIDLLIANLFFFLSNTLGAGVVWAYILPLFSAALFFDLGWTVLIIGASLLTLGVQAWALLSPPAAIAYTALSAVFYFPLGILMNFLRNRVLRAAESSRKDVLIERRAAENAQSEGRQALYNLISALSSTLNYQRVLDTALDMSATAISPADPQGEPLVSAVLLYAEDGAKGSNLRVGSARRFTPADLRIRLPGTKGVIGQAIDSGESQLSHEIHPDPELSRIVALRVCQAAYCVPLRTGLDTCGVLLFAHPEMDYFNDDRREILDMIGHQAVMAIQNARLYRDLEQEKERMIEIQEEARKKLARDLHDGPTQSVAALAMRVNFARRLIERDPQAALEELNRIEDLARRTTTEIRHMLFTLRPLVLESQGLNVALESMAEKMRETYNQDVIVSTNPSVLSKLEMNKQGVIFSIAEEAVNNARKHANAQHIWVRVKAMKGDVALLEVEDDGIGFDVEAVGAAYENRGSMGMVNMRERAELVNGVLTIDSEEGRGSCVRVLIPLTEAAADRLHRRK
jgi:signal transduction histidine kinase